MHDLSATKGRAVYSSSSHKWRSNNCCYWEPDFMLLLLAAAQVTPTKQEKKHTATSATRTPLKACKHTHTQATHTQALHTHTTRRPRSLTLNHEMAEKTANLKRPSSIVSCTPRMSFTAWRITAFRCTSRTAASIESEAAASCVVKANVQAKGGGKRGTRGE